MNYATCPICDEKMTLIEDGILRYCKCRCLGIDSTPEYTRYLGTIPVESPSYMEYKEKKKDVLDKMREIYRNNPNKPLIH